MRRKEFENITGRFYMENILEISKLNKSYTDFSLTDVSFSLPDNSITGFIGVNG